MLVKICRQHLDVQSRTASLHFTSRSAFWFSTSSGYLGNWCRIVSTHCLWISAFQVPTWTTSHQPKLSLCFLILALILTSLAVVSCFVVLLTLTKFVSKESYALLFRWAVRTEFNFHFTMQNWTTHVLTEETGSQVGPHQIFKSSPHMVQNGNIHRHHYKKFRQRDAPTATILQFSIDLRPLSPAKSHPVEWLLTKD